jgi:transposase InsO family protein
VALLKFIKLSSSTYYYCIKKFDEPDRDAGVKGLIKAIYERHRGRYGYRRIAAALTNQGQVVNRKRVQRLMGVLGIKSLVRPKKYCSYKGTVARTAKNILRRRFNAKGPNQKWTTDVTEMKVGQERLYLSPIMDLYNGEIVSYEIRKRPLLEMVTSMVKKAFSKLGKRDKPLLHSDQGWQYRMSEYKKLLRDRQVLQSMSRKGNCHDNASMESFFGILKTELFHLESFESFDQLKKKIDEYIEYYNYERIKLSLGGLSPVGYRIRHAQT